MRTAILYCPEMKQSIGGSFGEVEKMRMLASDYVANGEYAELVVVRIPRRLRWNRWTRCLEEKR